MPEKNMMNIRQITEKSARIYMGRAILILKQWKEL